jgi:phenylacetate-CoA ligase
MTFSYGNAFAQFVYYNSPFMLKNYMSSLYGWLQKRDRYGKFYYSHLHFLQKSQWLTDEELEEVQFIRLKEFLIHIHNHSKFYRDLFYRFCFHPGKFKSLSDLSILPLIEKSTIRDYFDDILAVDWKKYNSRWSHTSGTTGTGLQFPISAECFQREYAFRSLHYQWGNIHEEDRKAYCSGHPVAYYDREVPPFWVYDYINNSLLLSSYHLSEKNLPAYISELEKFQPELISGYPSSIYLLALANEDLGRPVHPRAIYTASETLFEYQREIIERSFGCKAFMWYGNSEMCANIVECEKGKYHLKQEHSYVEFISRDNEVVGPGKEAKLICTAFGNYAMPLVRYDIGDIGIVSEEQRCVCGRSGRIIHQIEGRTEDYILTADGRFVGRLDHIFKDATHVRLAQIVQDHLGEIIIRIMPERGYTRKDENDILRQTRLRLGTQMDIQIQLVEDIARQKNGKFRFIVSNIMKKTYALPKSNESLPTKISL